MKQCLQQPAPITLPPQRFYPLIAQGMNCTLSVRKFSSSFICRQLIVFADGFRFRGKVSVRFSHTPPSIGLPLDSAFDSLDDAAGVKRFMFGEVVRWWYQRVFHASSLFSSEKLHCCLCCWWCCKGILDDYIARLWILAFKLFRSYWRKLYFGSFFV